ncbi:MAG: rod shape-determining protein MreC [Candidatus Eisenbacteria bacterium]|nr:rod shape-determining protein MreC [Candidatus Eisenbacteria bacterium]
MRVRPRDTLWPIVVAVVLLGLLALARRSPIGPVRDVSDRILSPLENLIGDARSFGSLQSRNEELRRVATELAIENFHLKEYRYENRRLRRLLGFLQETPFRLLPSRVQTRSAGRSAETWKIDKGSADGVREGMAVINHRGLVGRVEIVLGRSASVRTLRNPDVRVSAVVDRTRGVGILAWQPRRGFRLLHVPNSASVEPGDRIVTSGLGGVFPPGLPLGTVRAAVPGRSHVFQEVWIAPEVDFSLLEEVYVVLEGPLAGPPEAGADDFLEQGYFEEIPPPEEPAGGDSAGADSAAADTVPLPVEEPRL